MANDLAGKIIADKYRVERLVRESDAGDLYEATHEISGAPVTLRILPPALAMDSRWAGRFLEQARKAASIDHPNILQLTDFGTDSHGYVYAVHEPFSLTTLADIEKAGPVLDEVRSVAIARQIAAVTAVAHGRGMVHAGLTPHEIFCETADTGESVKVLGFGADPMWVARNADSRYLAPEQKTEFAHADAQSDIYGIGIILTEMLTGDTAPESFEGRRKEFHAQLGPILNSATSRQKDGRYRSVTDLSEDLDRVWRDIAPKAKAATASAIWKPAAAVLIGILALGGFLIYATRSKQTDPATELVADAESFPVQPISGATGMPEETLIKMVGDAETGLMDNSNLAAPPGTLPGGDGYNAWAGGGAPPIGAPPPIGNPMPQYVPPGGQVVTIDPNQPSQFMPQEGGVILVPIPANTQSEEPAETKPRVSAANVGTVPAATPKPLATPVPRAERSPRPARTSPTPKPE